MKSRISPALLVLFATLSATGCSFGDGPEPTHHTGSYDPNGHWTPDPECGDPRTQAAKNIFKAQVCVNVTDSSTQTPFSGDVRLNMNVKYQLRGCIGGEEEMSVQNQSLTLVDGRQCMEVTALNGETDWISDVNLYVLNVKTADGTLVNGSIASYKYVNDVLQIEATFDLNSPNVNVFYEFALLKIKETVRQKFADSSRKRRRPFAPDSVNERPDHPVSDGPAGLPAAPGEHAAAAAI